MDIKRLCVLLCNAIDLLEEEYEEPSDFLELMCERLCTNQDELTEILSVAEEWHDEYIIAIGDKDAL